MNKKGLLGTVIAVVVVGIGVYAIANRKPTSDTKNVADQTLNLSAAAPLDTIDISKSTGYGQTGNVFESFFRLGKNGKATPGLADKYSVSRDGKTWTFHLRAAKWSNGDPITAQDFVYSWRRTINPKTKSEYAYLFDSIKNATSISNGKASADTLGIHANGKHTVVVELEKPVSYFKVLMAYPLFAPQNENFINKVGNKYATKSQYMLYSGPFKMVDWTGTGNKWSFVKNNQYWDKKQVKLHRINYTVVQNPSTGIDLYQQGKLDLTPLSTEQVKNFKNNKEYRQYPYSYNTFLKYNFADENTTKRKVINNRNARLAISLAINRDQLTKKVLGDGSSTPTGLVPEKVATDPKTGTDFAKEQVVKNTVDYKPALAKQYWQKALKQLEMKKVNFELLASNDDPESSIVTQYLKAQLQKELPGLTLNIRAIPGNSATSQTQKGDFDISLSGWGADFNDPISHLQIPVAGTSYNYGKYNNPTYNKLIAKANNQDANSSEKRWQDLVNASRALNKDQGLTPLYQQVTAYLQKPTIHGIIHNTAGTQWNYKYAYLK
ncbi:peptide ABC transporter substrate-binding protein [Lentilactobacillus kosonis]|uniref:Oligopeptide ABC transporter, periplasmic oligopeptide-binding protein OppA n=1 Tax=Lentilactobacillus kosonis TaxID=2810561 RepID=A0A401FIZ7_9LACO|nr:peptide ABC transporter substrate-binding protein [Lentilactobacillus kosonis]GAY72332.1 oligopeptide ABC transporter, periplasmic oligopeptide-binding protein OppA [Lentilactobacillus kosonis]